jgi:hypothetical protein
MHPSDEETSRRTVAGILLRLQRYVRGYLPDARIETDEDFSKNPAEVRIRVWWKDEGDQSTGTSQTDAHEHSTKPHS